MAKTVIPLAAITDINLFCMTSTLKSGRIQSIDILRGLVMVLMALDHVRDFFHFGATVSDPLDPETTTPILYFTRFITHYCAPVFVFLAGTSAFLYGRNKPKKELARFLFTRGLWLIFVEVVIMNLLWWFNPSYALVNLQVIWAIGLCMVFLSAIVFLPLKWIVVLGFAIVFGHNLLDGITMEGQSATAILWYITHQWGMAMYGERVVLFQYPVLAWVGVMSLGFAFGWFYERERTAGFRRKWFLRLGLGALALFFVLRGLNVYGDLFRWEEIDRGGFYTFLSFMNVTKYPPSLLYVLITLGPALLFLIAIENVQNRFTDWLLVFGRVPFFYYVLHVLVIHVAALIGVLITGGDWRIMIIDDSVFTGGLWDDYGYPLYVTYLVWIAVVVILFYPSRAYMRYKLQNKHKAWLSYL